MRLRAPSRLGAKPTFTAAALALALLVISSVIGMACIAASHADTVTAFDTASTGTVSTEIAIAPVADGETGPTELVDAKTVKCGGNDEPAAENQVFRGVALSSGAESVVRVSHDTGPTQPLRESLQRSTNRPTAPTLQELCISRR
ncbi:hypothetical protein ABH922_004501 [Rhodococcus sp. 27YEA15]|uniref:hypothetical protein n=1 Tax=Rhodococcus sp. 27YEA15 TaxID=3156259 RepID=UPI003C7BECB4